ncbi:MAG: 2-oxo-4-hydroxy-4-carboxy-5-ureidoimidazoline decarboxylase [Pseudomonadota bacterium]
MLQVEMMRINSVHQMSRDEFVSCFGEIYEESSWVAERSYPHIKECPDWEDLVQLMRNTVDGSSLGLRLALIRAHPDLAGRAAVAGSLSEASTSEQVGAGLDQCTKREFQRFSELNTAYKSKFGFPFIVAVTGLDRHQILEQFAERLTYSKEQEFSKALEQIHKIAHIRLDNLLDGEEGD